MPRQTLVVCAVVTGFALGLTCSASAQTASHHGPDVLGYHVTKTVVLGAPDRWDYFVYDSPSHRVYVAHGDRVTVVDGRDGKIVGEVQGLPGGTAGIAISRASGLGYTDDGEAGEAAAFSLRTLKIVK